MENNFLDTLEELIKKFPEQHPERVLDDFNNYLKLSHIVYQVKDLSFKDKLLYVSQSLEEKYKVKK